MSVFRRWGRQKQSEWAVGQINKRADDLYAIDLELMEWILAP